MNKPNVCKKQIKESLDSERRNLRLMNPIIAKLLNIQSFDGSRFAKFLKSKKHKHGYHEFSLAVSKISLLLYNDNDIKEDLEFIDIKTIDKILTLAKHIPDTMHPLKREIADFIFDNLRANIDRFSNENIIQIIYKIIEFSNGGHIIYNIVDKEFYRLTDAEFVQIIKTLIDEYDGSFFVYIHIKELKKRLGAQLQSLTKIDYNDLENLEFKQFQKALNVGKKKR